MDQRGDQYWIDDEVSSYAREIEVYRLPQERCIQVSANGSDVLQHLPGQLTLAVERCQIEYGPRRYSFLYAHFNPDKIGPTLMNCGFVDIRPTNTVEVIPLGTEQLKAKE